MILTEAAAMRVLPRLRPEEEDGGEQEDMPLGKEYQINIILYYSVNQSERIHQILYEYRTYKRYTNLPQFMDGEYILNKFD